MSEEYARKIKLLKLMEMLHLETDEEHPLTKTVICKKLSEMGIGCDVRTLARDVIALREYGYEIMEKMVSHDKAYYIADRSFSIPELKILIDAVQAATFIPKGKSEELIQKIANLAGVNEAAVLTGTQICFNTRKHSNESIYYTVLFLDKALRQQKKASFYYFDLNEWHEKIYRKEHSRYIVEPIALVYSNDNYYLMCYDENRNDVTNYRLDRMDSVKAEDDDVSSAAKELKLKTGTYTEQVFKMYNGEEKEVTLEFDPELIGAVFDKFGEKTKITRKNDICSAKVKVQISKIFFGWIFQFAGKMEIVSPKSVKKAFMKQINSFSESGAI